MRPSGASVKTAATLLQSESTMNLGVENENNWINVQIQAMNTRNLPTHTTTDTTYVTHSLVRKKWAKYYWQPPTNNLVPKKES